MTRATRHTLTRRGLFKAGAVAVPAAAAIGVLAGCSHTEDEPASEPVVVEEDSATSVTDTFEQVDFPLEVSKQYSLALGNVLHPGEDDWLPVTCAGETASPMVKGSALNLADGTLAEVVAAPVGGSVTTRVIYDVRCSRSLYAWLELDANDRSWALYASGFSNGELTGGTTTLWEADSEWDPAAFAVSGSTVIWQVQPSLSGSSTAEHSFCYLWKAGDANATAAVESPGRFGLAPTISNDVAILAPRVRADEGTYYGVTAYSMSDNLGSVIDQLVMPARVKPFKAARIGERFAVSVEATYGSGGLLGNMGTYIGTSSSDNFVTLAREPFAEIAGKDDRVIIKSRASYFMVDLAKEQFSVLAAMDNTLDYGEYPARAGECDSFVTFTTVKSPTSGYPSEVIVRSFDL